MQTGPAASPGYLTLYHSGELNRRAKAAAKQERDCALCPHECRANREKAPGLCGASNRMILASYGPHFGEEAPLVGRRGSGTIFFGYCNLRCVFCQNHELSFGGEGRPVTAAELARVMLKLQEEHRCHNINLVTPTHFVPGLLQALSLAVPLGLTIPLVYNCGGYESLTTLALLDGVVDIYMPDFKYDLKERALKYSGAGDYPERVKAALREMDRQVGGLKLDSWGIAYRGLLIRHLMLPGGLEDTRNILKFIKDELSPDCLVNLMQQYYPAHQAHRYPELKGRLDPGEYREALAYARQLGLRLA
jgi:putative pyruvate formate lyase activating enzyme